MYKKQKPRLMRLLVLMGMFLCWLHSFGQNPPVSNLYGICALSNNVQVCSSYSCDTCPPIIYICQGDTVLFVANHGINVTQPQIDWVFGGGSPSSALNQVFADTQTVVYNSLGTYYGFYFKADSTHGPLPNDSITIHVMTAPVATFTVPSIVCPFQSTCLTDNSNGGNIGSVTNWYLNGVLAASNTFNFCYTYSPGTYNVCYTVQRGSCKDSICQTIIVDTANVSFTAATACIGQPMTFYPSAPCFDQALSDYYWDFGDGYAIQGNIGASIPTGTNNGTTSGIYDKPDHIYSAAGTYTVTLIVQDNLNGFAQYTGTVTVYALPTFTITPSNNPYNVACGTEQYCIQPNTNTYTVSVKDYNGSSVAYTSLGGDCYQVDWGNYSFSGGYVIVTGTNSAGCSFTDTLTVLPCCTSGTYTTIYNDSTSNIFGNGPTTVNGGTYYINGQLIVNTSVDLNNVTLQMGPNARILIRKSQYGTAQLDIDKSYIWAGCNIMWDGIYIDGNTNATLSFTGNTMEDGINGIVSVNGGQYLISSNNIFNRNKVAVTVLPFSGTHPGIISTNTFECTTSLNTAYTGNASLLAPYAGQKSDCGVYAIGTGTQQGTLTIGDVSGPAAKNTFTTGLIHGIHAKNVNVNIYNNKFDILLTTATSKAVWLEGRYPTAFPLNLNSYTVHVGGPNANERNVFVNCKNGVYADVCLKGNIDYNKFEWTPIIGNTVPTGTAITYNNATAHLSLTMSIFRDTIINATTAVTCSNNKGSTTTISENYIEVTNTNLNTAVGITMADNLSTSSHYNVTKNEIKGIRTGIRGQRLYNAFIGDNTITVKPNGTTNGVWISDNLKSRVTNNTVTASPTAASNLSVGGVYVVSSQSSVVNCNTIYDIHHSIKFEGGSTIGGTVFKNDMSNAKYGVWLAGGAKLGNQGSSTTASDNVWSSISTARLYTSTLTNATIGSQTMFWYRPVPPNSTNYQPLPSLNGAGSTPVAVGQTSSSPTSTFCGFVLNPGSHHGVMVHIAQGGGSDDPFEQKWISQHGLYRELTDDTTGMENDSILVSFLDSMQNTPTGQLQAAIDSLNDTTLTVDYSDLQDYISSLSPDNELDAQLQKVAGIMATQAQAGTLNVTDLETLREYAQECPYVYGNAVYIARALLLQYDEPGTEYQNDCETDTTGGNWRTGRSQSSLHNTNFRMYPNPAGSSVLVEYSLKEGEYGWLQISSVTGTKSLSTSLSYAETVKQVSLDKLPAGVYICRLIVNGTVTASDKLIIIK